MDNLREYGTLIETERGVSQGIYLRVEAESIRSVQNSNLNEVVPSITLSETVRQAIRAILDEEFL